jgi:hypothetical protein
MTVRFVKFWNGRFPGSVETLDQETERRLEAADIAVSVLNISVSRVYYKPEPTAEQSAYAEQKLAELEALRGSST